MRPSAAGYSGAGVGFDDAIRETTMAMTLRATEASILYNAVRLCTPRKLEALMLCAAYRCRIQNIPIQAATRPRQTLAPLLGEPEFECLYPLQR